MSSSRWLEAGSSDKCGDGRRMSLSNNMRWKEQIAKLVRLDLAIRQAGTGGPWEWPVEQALAKARRAGLELNARTPQEPLLQVEAKRTVLEACAKQEARDQRKLQHERCAGLLPKL